MTDRSGLKATHATLEAAPRGEEIVAGFWSTE
jgi:hypothetical protein